MRKWLFEQVKAEPSQAGMFGGRVFSAGGVSGSDQVEDIPATPFIILRSGTDTATGIPGSPVVSQNWQVWCHEVPGSLVGIDRFIYRLKMWLPTRAPLKVDDDFIMACDFINASGDLPDDHYKTNTRYAEFKITARIGTYVSPAP